MTEPRKTAIILTLVLGLILTAYPDALALVGLAISPGSDPNFSGETFLAATYRGYEIWRDPARADRGLAEFIIYTPPGVVPGISSIKYTKHPDTIQHSTTEHRSLKHLYLKQQTHGRKATSTDTGLPHPEYG